MHDPIVGIDLGTSNSVVAVADGDGARVLADAQGHTIQPTVVSFHPSGSVIVGAGAKQRRILDPRNTVYSTKRLIGRAYGSREVTAAAARVPYAIKQGVNRQPVVATRAGELAVPEISAIVLDHLRGVAQSALGTEITRAVVAVPANFSDTQRSATVTAGDIAGLEVVQVLNEPTAAALAYGHRRRLNKRVAVYDFGGGTFDVTLLEVRDTVYEVLATAGDPFLGGDDMDERLVDTMVRLFRDQQGVDLHGHEQAIQRLRTVAEQVKIELSRRPRARVTIDELARGPGGAALDFSMRITRDDLEAHAAALVEQTFAVCREALSMAGLSTGDIEDVVLVGGTTKMPLVRRKVSDFFGRAPRTDVHPDEAVALGTAIHGQTLQRTSGRDSRRRRRRNTATGVAPPAPPMTARPPVSNDRGSPWARGSTMPWASFAEELDTSNVLEDREIGPWGDLETVDIPTINRELGVDFHPGDDLLAGGDLLPPAGQDPSGTGDYTDVEESEPQPQQEENPTALELAPTDVEQTALAPAGAAPGGMRDPGVEHVEHVEHIGDIEPLLPALPEPSQPYLSAPGRSPGGGGTPRPEAQAADAPAAPAAPAAPDPADWPAAPEEPPIILEVTPRGLGVATVAGYCRSLIAPNSRVPAEARQIFTTSKDMQQTVRIRVCEGESRRLDENTALGDLVLDGIEPKPRGQTRIEVTFGIDESGILHVLARDLNTGLEQSASLHIAGAPSPEEVTAAGERLRRLRR